jgi:hypothetical protein
MGPIPEATDASQPEGLLCNPITKMMMTTTMMMMMMMMMMFLSVFHCNEASVELNWQGKTEVLGEKKVPVPLCPSQIPH